MANIIDLLTARSTAPRPDHRVLVALGWVGLMVGCSLILFISMWSTSAAPNINNMDKVYHAGAYAVLTGVMIFAWPRRALPFIFCVSFLFGAAIELLQGTMTIGRTASIFDALANGVGAAGVTLIWFGLFSWIKPNPV